MDMYTDICVFYLGGPLVREVALRVDARVVQQVRLQARGVEWRKSKRRRRGEKASVVLRKDDPPPTHTGSTRPHAGPSLPPTLVLPPWPFLLPAEEE